MAPRWQLTVVALCTLLLTPFAHADIYRWDTGEVIPGTEGIELGPGVELTGWNTDEHNLRYADFSGGLSLTGARFWDDSPWWDDGSWLDNADFSGADLTGAHFGAYGFSVDIIFGPGATLTNVNLSGANLTDADVSETTLTGADLTGAIVTGASFGGALDLTLTKEQLYSTASYQQQNLRNIKFYESDLRGWDFSGQDLTDAMFGACEVRPGGELGDEVFSLGSDLADADLEAANLPSAVLDCASLRNSKLSRADLTNVARAFRTNFAGADLRGTNLTASSLDSARFRVGGQSAFYNKWTVFPAGFDPTVEGLIFMETPVGDFDMDDVLDTDDVDVLAERIRLGYVDSNGYWNDAMFDVNGDTAVDQEDHRIWVKELKHTWYGDANLDLEFNSGDMVQVFAGGKYETGEYAGWAQGDWDGNGLFDSSDMVAAFVDGGYEKGPRTEAVAIPEPTSVLLLAMGLIWLAICRRPNGS